MREQRPIKFRAWDSSHMLDDVVVHDMTVGQLNEYMPVMQYTGLKDKNGVEIYEGDVVTHRSFLGELQGMYEVRNSGWTFELFAPEHPEVSGHYITPTQLEVVGNVFENPDLLGDTTNE